ncbi:glutathione S-transferase family protein [Chachezhania antarctica]|uniref:glutathione S-transferase family protein n=1 Tax=Chachezhania antarctica TaxID=2340860 RepID=UPI000EB03F46|nr:glutathione S-transferase family protein [Chachezhania antarctica]|tara:strand:- start:6177 stop:6896 length:720 start_codon:yes stop_codon:yes gene_type:complete
MPVDPNAAITITAFDWVPEFARGQVRDLRVRWALEETGQDYAVRYLPQGCQKKAAHRALQPFGQVPTYEDGDVTLFESGAILWHIAERFPGLMPAPPDGQCRSLEWLFAALNTVEPLIMDRAQMTIFEAAEPWSAPRLPGIDERITERLQEVSDRLGAAEWLAGGFSAGDLMMVSVLRIIEGAGLIEAFPNLADYVTRAKSRPAFRQAMADHMAGFTGHPPSGPDERTAEHHPKQGVLT